MNLKRYNIHMLGLLVLALTAIPFSSSSQAAPRGLTQELSLDGTWDLVGRSPDKYNSISLKAQVPGQVHVDLLRDSIIPNPFWRDNAEKCRWVENWYWVYKKRFVVPSKLKGDLLQLQFDGLDTYAYIYLNGRKIGWPGVPTTDNMFQTYTYDVTKYLKYDTENVLEVRFSPLEPIVGDAAKNQSFNSAFADPLRPLVRRMQCTFGWDWVTRFVTMGIWRPCKIVSYREAYVNTIFGYTKSIANNQASLEFQVDVKSLQKGSYTLKTQLQEPGGKVVWENSSAVDSSMTVTSGATVKSPKLWWPNGMGEHPTYLLKSSLYDKSGTLLSEKQSNIGIRTVDIEEKIEDEKTQASSFIVKVNGVPLFCKGANWVPADPFPSRITRDKYSRLLNQATAAGINMLRVWGGGIYEPDSFYDMCDSLGILLWQEYMIACSNYPEKDPNFLNSYITEIQQNVVRLRNHPSLAIWSGGNEIALNYKISDPWCFKGLYHDKIIPLMKVLDPSCPFRYTSPYGNDPLTSNSSISGDAHLGAEYSDAFETEDGYLKYRDIIEHEVNGRFLSESAAAGAPTKRSLLKFMNEDDLSKSEMFDYHTNDNPYTSGGLTLFGRLERLAGLLYGNPNGDVDRRIRQMEYIHYDFVRLSLETTRCKKFYTSGLLFWMYNDCWPASGWSLIDYWGMRKAGWYAMASGCKPVIVATHKDGNKLNWIVTSDKMQNVKVNLTVKIVSVDGQETVLFKKDGLNVPANDKVLAFDMPLSQLQSRLNKKNMVVAQIDYDNTYDRSYWTTFAPVQIDYPKSGLKVKGFTPGTSGEITVSTDKWAHVVTFDADADFSDNYFELLPGETRTIKWKSVDGSKISDIQVKAWN
jgi:beta-mannosidase